MQISRFNIDLPGAFTLNGGGEIWNLTDSLTRNGSIDFDIRTQNLNFLTGLTGVTPTVLLLCRTVCTLLRDLVWMAPIMMPA